MWADSAGGSQSNPGQMCGRGCCLLVWLVVVVVGGVGDADGVGGGGGRLGGWVDGGDEDCRARARCNDVTELRVFHASNRI